jgi:hypothetical protein
MKQESGREPQKTRKQLHQEKQHLKATGYRSASLRRPVAPTSIHMLASALMRGRKSPMAVNTFLKHLVFRSFQICQETSANKESILGRLLVGMPDRSRRHQDLAVGAGCGS